LSAPLVRRILAWAALLGAIGYALQALAFILLSPTGGAGYLDSLDAAEWMWFLAWVVATTALAWSAWRSGLHGQMQLLPWRMAAAVATGVVAVGVLVVAAGGAQGDYTPGDVVQTVGLVMWAGLLVGWFIHRTTVAGRVADRSVDGALILGALALLGQAVETAVPGPQVGDTTPAVVGLVFALVGMVAAVVAMQRIKPRFAVLSELGVIQAALAFNNIGLIIQIIVVELVVQPNGTITGIRVGMAIPQVIFAVSFAAIAWAAAPGLWEKGAIPEPPPASDPNNLVHYERPADASAAPWIPCPRCGQAMSPDARFCSRCGQTMVGPVPNDGLS
jgi:hypothetical protein